MPSTMSPASPSSTLYLLASVTVVPLTIWYLLTSRKNARKALPPGPPGWPLLGNLLDMPRMDSCKTFTRWGEDYGEVTYVTALGQDIIVLNSLEVAVELMERRSAKYSDRPAWEMPKLMGWDNSIVMAPYGDRWRQYKKLITPLMNTRACTDYWPAQEKEVVTYMNDLLDNPDSFVDNFAKMAGRLIMTIVYGHDRRSSLSPSTTSSINTDYDQQDDDYVALARIATAQLLRATIPGAYLIETIPLLRYAPSWVGFKRDAAQWRRDADRMVDLPLEEVKKQRAAGTANPSFTLSLLEQQDVPDSIIRWASGTMYAAGADTTVSSIWTFFLAMVLHPEAQRKAREEINRVLGGEGEGGRRLPGMSDREELIYCGAVVKEVMRWYPVSMVVFRKTSVDDVYKDMLIPKDAMLLCNMWSIHRSKALYGPDADSFRPERWLEDPDLIDPQEYYFGFGRRQCPGQHLATNTIYLTMVTILSIFEILPKKGEVGPKEEYDFNSTVCTPLPFKCEIRATDEGRAGLVRMMRG